MRVIGDDGRIHLSRPVARAILLQIREPRDASTFVRCCAACADETVGNDAEPFGRGSAAVAWLLERQRSPCAAVEHAARCLPRSGAAARTLLRLSLREKKDREAMRRASPAADAATDASSQTLLALLRSSIGEPDPLTLRERRSAHVAAAAAWAAHHGDAELVAELVNDMLEPDATERAPRLCKPSWHVGLEARAAFGNVVRAAARAGRGGIVDWLLRISDAACAAHRDTALQEAAAAGFEHIVGALLAEHGANVRANQDLALRAAAVHGHVSVAALLLGRHGADVHALDEDALKFAAWGGHLEMVELLMRHGADVHVDRDAPLLYAAIKRRRAVMRALISRFGARVDVAARCCTGDVRERLLSMG